jgi:membrane fusion protein (multidrug efflux system)
VAQDRPPVAFPVETTLPHRGDISMYFETTTRVEAERRVDISAKANARCVEILVEEGDEVTSGQVLAELEKDEAQAAYVQSEVQVRQDQTSFEIAKRQFEEGLGPKVEMDNAYYTYEQALATLESQRIQLENLTIRAPIDGVVTSREILKGMLVNSGTQVFSIMDPSSFMLTISPPEKELPRLKLGQKAKVTIDSIRGREFEASIRRINPSVDPVSGTVKVVLDFDGEIHARLHESAFARVKLVMATLKNAMLVPKEAIIVENGRTYVLVARRNEAVDEKSGEAPKSNEAAAEAEARDVAKILTGEVEASVKEDLESDASEFSEPSYTAERVEVRTGLEDSLSVHIFSGLSDDDLVITNGQHTLKSGALIHLISTPEAIWSKADLSADEALAEAKERREEGGETATQRRGRHFGGG